MTTRTHGWQDVYQAARADSVAAALSTLHARFGPPTAGPGGHVISACRSTVDDDLLGREGLVASSTECRAGRDFAEGLAWLRLGLSERLLDECVAYLAPRTTGGTALLELQMVRGDLADAGAEQMEVRATLVGAPAPEDLPGIHRRLTEADRVLLRLLGASGFLAGGPGGRAVVSELLADIYLDREDLS